MKFAQRISEKQGMGDSRRQKEDHTESETEGPAEPRRDRVSWREEARGGESDLTTTQHARRIQHAILQNPFLSALLAIRTQSRPKVTASSSRH